MTDIGAASSLDLPPPPDAAEDAIRVAAAMSGGVDSAVVAAALHRAGYAVVGITLQLYPDPGAGARPGACCAGRDIRDARAVAASCGFPHYVLDYESRFRAAVIDDFADQYLAGATPVPCIRCNQRVKFRDLLDTALELGAEWLATGHYVRRVDGPMGPELHRAADAARDQSYFLFATTREQLARLHFPLGALPSKAATRALAADLGLSVAEKPDSQDICFAPDGKYAAVIERLRPGAAEPGDIVDIGGRVLGTHRGVIHYTVGQRRGLGLSGGAPRYVVRLDAAARRVVVGPREALATRVVRLDEVNWLGDGAFVDAPPQGWDVEARVRSTRPPRPARVRPLPGGRAEVELAAPEEGVAPGQACVFYDPEGTRMLGGGWIARG